MVEVIEDYARADSHRALLEVEVGDFAVVAGKINDQPLADGAPTRPVPAPRGMTGTPAWAAAWMTALAWRAPRGKATAMGSTR